MIKGASLSSLILWSNNLTVFEDLDLKGLAYLFVFILTLDNKTICTFLQRSWRKLSHFPSWCEWISIPEDFVCFIIQSSLFPSSFLLFFQRYLAYNSITSIPAELGSLYSLQRYSIHHNRLREIGSYALSELFSSYSSSVLFVSDFYSFSFALISSISDLSYNSLTTLPADFGSLTQLSSLFETYNPPNWFHFVSRDLSHNKFASFPYSLLDIYGLSVLFVVFQSLSFLFYYLC